jgi:hypothetical protein
MLSLIAHAYLRERSRGSGINLPSRTFTSWSTRDFCAHGRIFRSKVEGYPTTSERRVGRPGGEKGGLVAKPALSRCETGPSPSDARKSEGARAQLSAASL